MKTLQQIKIENMFKNAEARQKMADKLTNEANKANEAKVTDKMVEDLFKTFNNFIPTLKDLK